MKKQLLFGIALCIAGATIAQNSATTTSSYAPIKINPKVANKALPYIKNQQLGGENQNSFENIVSSLNNKPKTQVKSQNRAFTTTTIGTTGYQLQTNASICNRIVKSPDGTISACWTFSTETASWSERGSGYNYFDGSNWGASPTLRVENVRTGFPSIGVTATGEEVIITHDGTSLHNASRATKGTGAWANASLSTVLDTWPRMSIGGANGQTIHVISQTSGSGTTPYHGQNGAVSYSRSQNGGVTWDKQRTVIPEIDSSNYLGFGGDQYSIDAKGDTVAIVIGGFDTDVILLKSINNGDSWTKTIVHKFPIPFYDAATMVTDTVPADGNIDTLETNDASVAVLLDNQGNAHVWYGRMRVVCDAPGTGTGQGLSYFPGTDGLMYWNENMGSAEPVMIEGAYDLNANGTLDMYIDPAGATLGFGSYQVSLTSHPSAGIDPNGNIYLSYSSIFEGMDDQNTGSLDNSTGTHTGKDYRHTFVASSNDGGLTWCPGKDITNPESPLESGAYDLLEGVYGAMAKDADGFVHLIVQQDNNVGHGVSTTTPVDPQNSMIADIVYYKIPVADVLCTSGINEYGKNNSNVSVYPNPANTSATLTFTNTAKENVVVKMYNVTGQMVAELTNQTYNAGTHNLNVDLAKYNAGIYFYTVTVGSNMISGKMIVE